MGCQGPFPLSLFWSYVPSGESRSKRMVNYLALRRCIRKWASASSVCSSSTPVTNHDQPLSPKREVLKPLRKHLHLFIPWVTCKCIEMSLVAKALSRHVAWQLDQLQNIVSEKPNCGCARRFFVPYGCRSCLISEHYVLHRARHVGSPHMLCTTRAGSTSWWYKHPHPRLERQRQTVFLWHQLVYVSAFACKVNVAFLLSWLEPLYAQTSIALFCKGLLGRLL